MKYYLLGLSFLFLLGFDRITSSAQASHPLIEIVSKMGQEKPSGSEQLDKIKELLNEIHFGSGEFYVDTLFGKREKYSINDLASYRLLTRRTDHEESALGVAAYYNLPEVIELLLNYSADPNVTNTQSETPLKIAIDFGNVNSVQMLLRDPETRVDANVLQAILKETSIPMKEESQFDIFQRIFRRWKEHSVPLTRFQRSLLSADYLDGARRTPLVIALRSLKNFLSKSLKWTSPSGKKLKFSSFETQKKWAIGYYSKVIPILVEETTLLNEVDLLGNTVDDYYFDLITHDEVLTVQIRKWISDQRNKLNLKKLEPKKLSILSRIR